MRVNVGKYKSYCDVSSATAVQATEITGLWRRRYF